MSLDTDAPEPLPVPVFITPEEAGALLRPAVYDCCDALIGAPHRPGCPVGHHIIGLTVLDPTAFVRLAGLTP